MKKLVSMLLVAVLVITSMVFSSGCNSANPASDFEYSISESGKNAVIEKYIGNDKSVVIPEEIEGATVTKIESGAFLQQDIESVVIPDTVVNVLSGAFMACTKLKTVKLGNSVANIFGMAFSGCTSLEEINFPDSLEMIGDRTFENCTSLKKVSLPTKNNLLEQNIFYKNTALTSVEFREGEDTLKGWGAFANASALEEITIPASVKKIIEPVFIGCPSLKKVTFLGDAPTEVYENTFAQNEVNDLKIYYKKGTKGWDTTDLAKWYTLVEY